MSPGDVLLQPGEKGAPSDPWAVGFSGCAVLAAAASLKTDVPVPRGRQEAPSERGAAQNTAVPGAPPRPFPADAAVGAGVPQGSTSGQRAWCCPP